MSDNPPPTTKGLFYFEILGRSIAVSRLTYQLALGVIVGALTGLVAVVFRMAAILGHEHFFPYRYEEGSLVLFTRDSLMRVVTPVIGGAICGVLLFKFGKFSGSHSIPAILRAVASGRTHFKPRVGIPPALAIVTLATGGSAGPEGPIAELGSLMGSLIGRWAKAPVKMMKTLIASGVAAGIAAVFNAPIGGVFFAIEVILRNYDVASFTPIVVAAVVASVIAQAALGSEGMALTIPALELRIADLPYFLVLGLICGGISVVYIYGIEWCHGRFQRLRVPMWMRPAIGGLMVGVIGLFAPLVMGEGYEWVQTVIDGDVELARIGWLLFLLVILKILATGLTLGSGNPGGSFAPAVFVGVMGGAAYGLLLKYLGLVDDATPFAVMGMAGLIAGALGAPITGIMIALGFGGATSLELLLALMGTVVMCMVVMQVQRNVSVYTLEFVRLGIDLDRARGADPLSLIGISSVMQTTGYETLQATMPVHEALERMKDSADRWFVVRRRDGRFLGIVSLHEMRLAIAEEELGRLLVLEDITDSFQPRLHPEMSIKDALESFGRSEAEVLPVCEGAKGDGELAGVLSRQDALDAYRRCADAMS
jgi:CIC family chloride channel protein